MTTTASSHSGSKQDLFSYTTGRYLYNEHIRLAERYVEFNIGALEAVAVRSVDRKKVVHTSKLAEGGFNRIFLLTMDDGFEVIAKIPFPLTVPKRLTTESEVATLDLRSPTRRGPRGPQMDGEYCHVKGSDPQSRGILGPVSGFVPNKDQRPHAQLRLAPRR